METKPPPWTLAEVAALIGGRLVSGGDFSVRRLVPADSDDPNGLAFVEGESYLRRAEASKVGALLVGDGISSAKPHVQVDSPRRAFRKLTDACRREPRLNPGVHPSAVVDPSAQLHPSARIGPFAVVESGASVGARSRVCAFAYIGDDCRVGEDCLIYPHAVLVQDVRLGDRVIVHAGAVLGADGFGFEWDGTGQRKIAQVGGVVVGNDAEIGALSAVDRATVGDTLLGDGVKLDNLVQIAHNVRIGAHSVIASQVGIAGSTKLGERVVMGGQAGASDHLDIASDVAIAGRGGVVRDLDAPGAYLGMPALPAAQARRAMVAYTKLPELRERIRELERRIAELEQRGE